MAFELINDPSDPGFNSFCSLQEANDYMDSINPELKEVWDNVGDPEAQARFLVQATDFLDQRVTWSYGTKTDPDQPLSWPRKNVPVDGVRGTDPAQKLSSDALPRFLKRATAVVARNMAKNFGKVDPLAGLRDNFKSVELSGIKIQLNPNQESDYITGEALGYLQDYGTYAGIQEKQEVSAPDFTIGRIIRGA